MVFYIAGQIKPCLLQAELTVYLYSYNHVLLRPVKTGNLFVIVNQLFFNTGADIIPPSEKYTEKAMFNECC